MRPSSSRSLVVSPSRMRSAISSLPAVTAVAKTASGSGGSSGRGRRVALLRHRAHDALVDPPPLRLRHHVTRKSVLAARERPGLLTRLEGRRGGGALRRQGSIQSIRRNTRVHDVTGAPGGRRL